MSLSWTMVHTLNKVSTPRGLGKRSYRRGPIGEKRDIVDYEFVLSVGIFVGYFGNERGTEVLRTASHAIPR